MNESGSPRLAEGDAHSIGEPARMNIVDPAGSAPEASVSPDGCTPMRQPLPRGVNAEKTRQACRRRVQPRPSNRRPS
ncbi:MAG: hypothetical protein VKP57_07985 [Candidatus Sericytochromatia bacterium]|nr:hypothetical protein [Candidatus Sericytochromatia bacterium]